MKIGERMATCYANNTSSITAGPVVSRMDKDAAGPVTPVAGFARPLPPTRCGGKHCAECAS